MDGVLLSTEKLCKFCSYFWMIILSALPRCPFLKSSILYPNFLISGSFLKLIPNLYSWGLCVVCIHFSCYLYCCLLKSMKVVAEQLAFIVLVLLFKSKAKVSRLSLVGSGFYGICGFSFNIVDIFLIFLFLLWVLAVRDLSIELSASSLYSSAYFYRDYLRFCLFS